ncbi:MAG TPA: tRNA (adenosine(37)-N6)-threonylcarbamoyltransferase complex dimerization subunit type 1 TsaB [Verrucomicrobiota bacterium]|nr:tRNA (adenosine(37)-N6)-threonylcarbamoyltransferase complex dimerization subunit type 1 TsaB [Verrucomicrobiota bacterium]HNU50916.1 tRNA (adenosine(37)-N6)-threonylcarbamoyltransferase complex dimerization subunit type 1 TsaB [Verrucomicrobiota bacterium]
MKILAFEFSSDCRSVAAFDPGHAPPVVLTQQSPGPQTGAFALLDNLLHPIDWKPADVDRIAVGLGPGSYTGIRIAIAIAQAWHLAHQTPLVGVRTIDGLAFQALARTPAEPVTLAVNAHRGEFYVLRVADSGSGVREIEPLHLEPAESVNTRLRRGERVAGPGLAQAFPGGVDLLPDAGVIARLAAQGTETAPGQPLDPVYLRTPQFKKAPPPQVPPPTA